MNLAKLNNQGSSQIVQPTFPRFQEFHNTSHKQTFLFLSAYLWKNNMKLDQDNTDYTEYMDNINKRDNKKNTDNMDNMDNIDNIDMETRIKLTI